MSLMQFLRIIWARKWIIVASTLACFVVAFSISQVLPKRYQGTARILLDTLSPDPVTGQTLGGMMLRGYTATQVQLITDAQVVGGVVDRLNLTQDPGFIAGYAASGGTELGGGIRRWISGQIIANTSANLVAGSSILEITYQGPSPELSRNVAGLLRDAYIESSLRLKTDAASRNGEWFREQAIKAQRALSAAEQARNDFMRENNLIVQNGQELESQKLASLTGALMQARGNAGTQDAAATARLANDPVVDQLRVQVATLEDQIAQANEKLGPEHPTYKALVARRNLLQRQLGQAQSQSRVGVSQATGASRATIADLERQVEAQRQKVLGMKGTLDRFAQLDREVQMRQAEYQNAAQRAGQLRLAADVSETGMVILGDPTALSTPVWPNVPLISLLSLAFGFGLGLMLTLLMEFLARRVRGPEDLAHAVGAPVLALVAERDPSPWRARLSRLLSRKRDLTTDDAEFQPA